jgi:hypothetical protein
MIRVIQHNCAKPSGWIIPGLETAVERREDVVCFQVPPRESAGIEISLLAYEMRKRKNNLAGDTERKRLGG